MNEKVLFKHYRLHPERIFNENGKTVYLYQNQRYFFSPIMSDQDKELTEMKMLSDYMYMQGESSSFKIVPTFEQKLSIQHENKTYILLSSQDASRSAAPSASYGSALKSRHERGSTYPYPLQTQTRLGKWKDYWATRLEQMEKFWYSRAFEQPLSTFEKKFNESFPYYMGLCENAMQYIADSEWEDKDGEQLEGTICTERAPLSIEQLEQVYPWDWVYDHPARDLSEWIRSVYWEEGYENSFRTINSFLNDYEARGGLTLTAWRMIYGRLLFPLHYFQCVESFFTTKNDRYKEQLTKQLEHMLENSRQYELFLRDFYKGIGLKAKNLKLPQLHWL